MDTNKHYFPKGTKFLVTGGAGFIGSNLVETLLNLDYEVRILDDFSTGKRENINEFHNNTKFQLIEGDIRNLADCQRACIGIDYVLHQAALGSVPRSIEDPRSSNDVNITGTLNMLIAARDEKVKRFVFASSSSVYGDEPNLPKQENRLGFPLSPYAATKLTDEIYLRIFYKVYGLPTVGLRYFNVFGKNQDPHSIYAAVIPLFVKTLMEDKPPSIFGDGNQSRDFTYIDNVVEANLKACLAREEVLGEIFNVANGGNVTINELYNKICSLMKKDIKPIYMSQRPGDIQHSHADISKARNLLKYDPKVSVDEGLARSINWYQEHL